MAPQKSTPEEKLFAVIQGAKHPPVRSRVQALSLASVGAILKTLTDSLDLSRINQALTVVIGILAGVCVLNPLVMHPRLDRLLAQAAQQMVPFEIGPPLEGLRSTETTVQFIQDHDPFHISPPAGTPSAAAASEESPEPAAPNYQAALQDFKLVGISWGADPTAMIEQQSTHQTFFLRPGQVVGPFTVKAVSPNRVTLHAGDQDFELF